MNHDLWLFTFLYTQPARLDDLAEEASLLLKTGPSFAMLYILGEQTVSKVSQQLSQILT